VFSEDSELQALYHSFLRRLPDMIESIKDSAQQQNWLELAHVSHQLKGLGGSFGYHQLTAVCKNIHDCARQQSNDKLDELIAELQKEYSLIQHGDMTRRKAV
jgi:HPt (histidine-containing phosphotransfer) domain-containing protein